MTLVTHEATRTWIVEGLGVVDEGRTDLLQMTADDRLTLLTCYPFDGLTRSSRRYVVWCRPGERVRSPG